MLAQFLLIPIAYLMDPREAIALAQKAKLPACHGQQGDGKAGLFRNAKVARGDTGAARTRRAKVDLLRGRHRREPFWGDTMKVSGLARADQGGQQEAVRSCKHDRNGAGTAAGRRLKKARPGPEKDSGSAGVPSSPSGGQDAKRDSSDTYTIGKLL